MSSATVTVSKFVGTISLGLMTGLSYTLTTTTLPALLTLPTYTSASKTHTQLSTLFTRQTAALSTLATTSFLIAYFLSPRRSRHPYLFYALLAVGGGWYKESYALLTGGGKGGSVAGKKLGKDGKGTPETSDEEWEDGGKSGELNGEMVRLGVEGWRNTLAGKALVWGIGWTVAVIGIWGDGA